MEKTSTLPFDASIMNPANELVGKIALKFLDKMLVDYKECREQLLVMLRISIYGRILELEMEAQESGHAIDKLGQKLRNDEDD